jgi:hypothetical protein
MDFSQLAAVRSTALVFEDSEHNAALRTAAS